MEAAGFDFQRALQLYLWNTAVGQSFHFPLQTVEVALRNAVAEALTDRLGRNWWHVLTASRVLDAKALNILEDTRDRIIKKGISPSTDEMIAHLSFGFWVSLLARRYNPEVWSSHLTVAFPAAPKAVKLAQIHFTARKLLELRNRVFHQEPLIGMDLSARYSDIMQLLGWICPETKAWTKANTSVPKVLRQKP